ncbi:hypothetical protein [Pectobacterium fontis]|uniref:DUF1120 domain-containing protein n=1 Tax=Pectobacterium fontis TaxID=2558042 RepID=A0A7V8IIM1_9GAMM|nr:hypothetical protein [Pectobacterium fontis]KHN51562.1 hypothetical protein OI69_11085 [Pectobacterium fontis]
MQTDLVIGHIMLKTVKRAACVLAVLVIAPPTEMIDGSDIKIIGTLKLTACKSILADGSLPANGITPSALIKRHTFTVLDEKKIRFSTVCDGIWGAIDAIGKKPGEPDYYDVGELFEMRSINMASLEASDIRINSGGYDISFVPDSYAVDGENVSLLIHRNTFGSWGYWKFDNKCIYHASDKRQQFAWTEKSRKLRSLSKSWLAHRVCSRTLIKRQASHQSVKLDGILMLEMVYL